MSSGSGSGGDSVVVGSMVGGGAVEMSKGSGGPQEVRSRMIRCLDKICCSVSLFEIIIYEGKRTANDTIPVCYTPLQV